MAGRGLARIIRQGARALARKQPMKPHYALAFSGTSGQGVKLMSGLPPDGQDLLARCGGNAQTLNALTKRYDGDLNQVHIFLTKVEQGLAAYRIDAEGDVVMRVTEKGAQRAAEHAAKIHEHSVY
jgi:hypothetical protein